MPRVAIPLVIREAGAEPLQGMVVSLPGDCGMGDLPWELHAVSLEEEQKLLGWQEPPAAVWYPLPRVSDEKIREKAISLLGTLHLLGTGVARVSEAWIYQDGPVRLIEAKPLRLQLLGRGGEFFLAVGTNEDAVASAYERVTAALSSAPWLRISLEHMLLALDKTGLSNGLLDMTICLESLIRVNAELSFRFSHQISRLVTSSPSEIEDYQSLLHDLYTVRSTHVHGGEPKDKALKHVERRIDELESIMRDAIIYALEFHARAAGVKDAWTHHLGQLLHGTARRVSADWGTKP